MSVRNEVEESYDYRTANAHLSLHWCMTKSYSVYIVTNPAKTVLYIGMTNDLASRLIEHYLNKGKEKTFAGRYFCYNLVYFEDYQTPLAAIAREKELKDWNRNKKEELINSMNPEWKFLNDELIEWPPAKDVGPRY